MVSLQLRWPSSDTACHVGWQRGCSRAAQPQCTIVAACTLQWADGMRQPPVGPARVLCRAQAGRGVVLCWAMAAACCLATAGRVSCLLSTLAVGWWEMWLCDEGRMALVCSKGKAGRQVCCSVSIQQEQWGHAVLLLITASAVESHPIKLFEGCYKLIEYPNTRSNTFHITVFLWCRMITFF